MDFCFPQQVHLGQGVSQRFGLSAKDCGSRVLLLADEALEGSQELSVLLEGLERAGVAHLVVSRPAQQSLEEARIEAVAVANASRMDVLAAVGGSDQLSLGRAVAASLSALSPVPYLEVPTAVCFPLLLRPEAFVSTGHPSAVRFVPFPPGRVHHIFLDPHLTTAQTAKASVASLVEALFYGVELYLKDSANLIHQGLTLAAIEALWSSLRRIHDNPSHAEYRLVASEAGFAISAAAALGPRSTGVSFAYVLAGLAGLATSTMGSLMLAPLLEGHSAGAGVRLVPLARAFGLEPSEGPGPELAGRMAQEVRRELNTYQLPLRLTDYKLVDTQISQAVDVVRGLDLRRSGVLDPEHLPDFVRRVL